MAGPTHSSEIPGPVSRIEQAHKMYREGMHKDALALYTEALAMAGSKAQRIALHSNRAACYLKLRDFKKAAEECSSVLELDQQHTGALMLRVQIMVTLKDYHAALFDVNRLIEMDQSSDVYHDLLARLKTQLSLAPIPESDEEAATQEEEEGREREKERAEESKSPGAQLEAAATGDSLSTATGAKGHRGFDYSRWDNVDDDSGEEEDDEDDDDDRPRYRFRVRTL